MLASVCRNAVEAIYLFFCPSSTVLFFDNQSWNPTTKWTLRYKKLLKKGEKKFSISRHALTNILSVKTSLFACFCLPKCRRGNLFIFLSIFNCVIFWQPILKPYNQMDTKVQKVAQERWKKVLSLSCLLLLWRILTWFQSAIFFGIDKWISDSLRKPKNTQKKVNYIYFFNISLKSKKLFIQSEIWLLTLPHKMNFMDLKPYLSSQSRLFFNRFFEEY